MGIYIHECTIPEVAMAHAGYTVDDVAFIGRTFDEYCRMFVLAPVELVDETVLDCPAGPAAFVATAHEFGTDVTGVDVRYDQPAAVLRNVCASAVADACEELERSKKCFSWEYYGSVEDRVSLLRVAYQRFLDDYLAGRTSGRYVCAELPQLPFADDWFSPVLSSHFLFLYGDRFSVQFHCQTYLELARVTDREVRVYPSPV